MAIKIIVCALLQERTGPGRMWWAPQSHSQQAALRERRSAPADGGSTAASEWQPYRCAKHCGASPWWCACAPPGQGSPSWPSWPLKSSTPPSPSPGLPPPGTASSSPSITSATCARTQRDSRPDRDSGEPTATCSHYQARRPRFWTCFNCRSEGWGGVGWGGGVLGCRPVPKSCENNNKGLNLVMIYGRSEVVESLHSAWLPNVFTSFYFVLFHSN